MFNDSEIIKAISEHSEKAISDVINKYDKLLWKVADGVLKYAGSAEDVEEVVADVFIFLWKHPEKYSPDRGSLKTFLCVAARSRALDKFRELTRHITEELDENVPLLSPDGADELVRLEENEKLYQAIEELKPEDKDFLIRRYFLGQKPGEISEFTGVDCKKIENSLYRSKQKLKEKLKG